MMEPRDFYDAVEYWGGLMTFGSAAGPEGIESFAKKTSSEQLGMFSEYMRTLPYERFLQTRYWHAIRLSALKLYKHTCAVCDKKQTGVDVHHRTYEHRGSEFSHMEDLRLLCRPCHLTVHEAAIVMEQGKDFKRKKAAKA